MNVIEDEILKKIRYGVFLYFLSRPYYFLKKYFFHKLINLIYFINISCHF